MSPIKAEGSPESRRREVLRVLRASTEPMSIVSIAEELRVHPNTVRFHLESLVGTGQVEQAEPGRKGPGRPPLMFSAVRQMDRGGPRNYRMLAEILTTAVAAERDPGAMALAAGLAWGRSLASHPADATGTEGAIEHLVDVLDDLGFAPERRSNHGELQVGLRHCPFLELAENRTGVVCPIHLGIMQGALETWNAPVSVSRLDEFVEPDLCLAHLKSEAVN